MNTFSKYLLVLIGVVALGFAIWYFSAIVIYILVAGVLTLIGRPVVDLLTNIRIRNFKIPRWLSALLTLILLWILVITFFRIFVPLIANEANELSKIDSEMVLQKLEKPREMIP